MAEAACRDRSWLFTSVDRRDHERARISCVGDDTAPRCPLFDACAATAADILAGAHRAGLHGTWAGQLYGSKGAGRTHAREHGTERGYQQHRHAGEEKCEPCKRAHAATWHERKAAS